MQVRNKPDDGQLELMVIGKPEAIRLIFSEKHNRILKRLAEKEQSISDIARSLDYNPGSVHYHLKELEKQGLVRQVRQEIKGGIVKKYYRSVARHICLESPDFNNGLRQDVDLRPDADLAGGFNEKLLQAIECLGYTVSEDNREEAIEMLTRYDRRIKELMREIISQEADISGEDRMMIRHACQFVINMRTMDDQELGRIYKMFSRSFLKVQ
ncbi:MAG: ArsR family transcriptional regulator [Methanocella sp.]